MSLDPADRLYEAIRVDTNDVLDIARATGLKNENIAKVKAHVFLELHWLDQYESLGVPGEWRRFDSNLRIAEAWQRLRTGQHQSSDLELLRHEAAEAWFMKKHGPSYRLAHQTAQRRYPAPSGLWC